ncbi:MAG: glutaminyl-peptide cyclotransferase [Bacteroidota bacterium]|nr:glutaminyl-peptide cyclotransferase [Bacteroidota bacterium]
MNKFNLLIASVLGFCIVSCADDVPRFELDTSQLKQHYKLGEEVVLEVKNQGKTTIDSVVYYFDKKKIQAVDGKLAYTIDKEKFGEKSIEVLVFSAGKSEQFSTKIEVVSNVEPQMIDYEIVNTYNHDIGAYTQGLEFYNGTLYESTGHYGKSTIRKTDVKTGSVIQSERLDNKYFGEGITVLNDKLYQLTWRENKGFIYNPTTLQKIEEFEYFKNTEGWGLTNDGQYIYHSDGTEIIYVLDPNTLKEVDYIKVYTALTKIPGVNEMEWVEGKIFANIYTKDAIAVINPKTGAVEKVLDLSELRKQVTQHGELDVLNGIAYNKQTKTLFVTGKNWDKMFEIRIKE